MTIRPFAAVLSAAVLLTVHPSAQQKFKVSTNTVALYVTVTDAERHLVPDLIQEDFEVYDNGKPQAITSFDNHPLPITTTVMLDTSGSMTASLDLVKRAAEQFLIRLLPDDMGMVGAFNDKIEFHPANFTANRDELVGLLKDLDFGYPTRLYDAVDESIGRLNGIDGRKVVLVFTDGEDTASKLGAGKVMERARAEDVMVYSVGLDQRVLQRPAPGAHQPGQRAEEPLSRDGRRVLPAEVNGRAGSDVHPHRGRTSQPVRARFRPGSDGRQDPQAGSAPEEGRTGSARAQELPGHRHEIVTQLLPVAARLTSVKGREIHHA